MVVVYVRSRYGGNIENRENLAAGPAVLVYGIRCIPELTIAMSPSSPFRLTKDVQTITPRSSTLENCEDNNITIEYLGGGGTRDLSRN